MAPTPERMDAEACEMSSGRLERGPDDCDQRTTVRARQKHDIFLSYSGAQRDFVEQLCKDLEEAQLSPFFDRLDNCLPKGEKYAERIFNAARECKVAVVVISDEYFSGSKWPMLELEELMPAEDPTPCQRKILPLFLKLSCKDCQDQKRQEQWFRQWNEWAESGHKIDVGRWKNALSRLVEYSGFEFVKEVGEVAYRANVVNRVRELITAQHMVRHFLNLKPVSIIPSRHVR